jgi:APA family basic amino acid/polyamine antiporter
MPNVFNVGILSNAEFGREWFVLRRREPHLPRPFPAWGYPWTPLAALIGSLVYLALNIGSDFKNGLLALTFVALSYPAFLLAVRLRARES